ncbi:hypothetical protein AVEN_188327-1 [Araneus ventricosus]|uniref:Uncharacterized protein n=1 Tax=Araneus ventricosus TaxID=182803 RepID=A0A4Y2T769_ARAVE|nr:hypothetical protein AVEN_188327-1 [Araneus ventricosus]
MILLKAVSQIVHQANFFSSGPQVPAWSRLRAEGSRFEPDSTEEPPTQIWVQKNSHFSFVALPLNHTMLRAELQLVHWIRWSGNYAQMSSFLVISNAACKITEVRPEVASSRRFLVLQAQLGPLDKRTLVLAQMLSLVICYNRRQTDINP